MVLPVTAAFAIPRSFQCKDQQEYNARKDHDPYGHPEKDIPVVALLVHVIDLPLLSCVFLLAASG